MSDWTSPATITGLWGALASTAAAVIAWRVFRWQRQSDVDIVVTCEFEPHRQSVDWLVLTMLVRNLSSTRWQFKDLSFRPASSAKGVSHDRAVKRSAAGGREFDDTIARAHAASPVPLIQRVEAAGTSRPAHGGGYGDFTRVEIYIERASIRSSRLSMRLSLLSMDAVQRKTTIAIVRDVPPPITAAAA